MLKLTKYAHVYIAEGRILVTDNPFIRGPDCHLKNFVISKDKRIIKGDSFDWDMWIDCAVLSSPDYDEIEPEFMETIEKRTFFFFKHKVTQPKKYYIKKGVNFVILKRLPPWTIVEVKNE